jgi:cholesterol transport system auxiliary component
MKCVVLLVAAALFGGCVTSHRLSKQQYDLGEFAASRHESGGLAVKVVIRDVSQPSWLRTKDIFYRFDYAAPSRRLHYATSEWVATAGELVTFRLQEVVAAANAGLTLPTSNGTSGYVLQTNLEEFTQIFTAPARSRCIVQLRATLWQMADQVVAQHLFRIEIPAPTPDASGAALCLATAVTGEADDIVRWLSDEVARARSGDISPS